MTAPAPATPPRRPPAVEDRPRGPVHIRTGVDAQEAAAALTATLPRSDGRLAGRTVLVVDDDARNVFALTGMLEFHGMRVLTAENGLRGIEVLESDPGIELILMDVMMPEMDGYRATALIRAMPDRARLPIIAVTAKAMQGDREKSLAAGASDYVTKPVDAAALIGCIQRALDL